MQLTNSNQHSLFSIDARFNKVKEANNGILIIGKNCNKLDLIINVDELFKEFYQETRGIEYVAQQTRTGNIWSSKLKVQSGKIRGEITHISLPEEERFGYDKRARRDPNIDYAIAPQRTIEQKMLSYIKYFSDKAKTFQEDHRDEFIEYANNKCR